MKLLDDYFKIQKELYDYFGYEEDWVVIPIEDSTEFFWCLIDESEGNAVEVQFAEKIDDILYQTGNHYCDEIYHQRFLNKWVYRKDEYTMVCVDTHTDGNKFLRIFDNKKEIKQSDIKNPLYEIMAATKNEN
jgi:hypothetical protein